MSKNLQVSKSFVQNTSKTAVPTAKGLELGREWNIDIWSIQNPLSMMSVMDKKLRAYFIYRREEIMKEIITIERGWFNGIDEKIRERLWKIYDVYPSAMEQATLENLSANICLQDHLEKKLQDVKFCAFLLIPVETYSDKVNTALDKALSKIHEILDNARMKDSQGNFDNKAANTVLKAAKFLDDRAKGRPGKTLHVVDHRPPNPQIPKEEKLEDIEAAIIELEGKTKIVDEIDEAEVVS